MVEMLLKNNARINIGNLELATSTCNVAIMQMLLERSLNLARFPKAHEISHATKRFLHDNYINFSVSVMGALLENTIVNPLHPDSFERNPLHQLEGDPSMSEEERLQKKDFLERNTFLDPKAKRLQILNGSDSWFGDV